MKKMHGEASAAVAVTVAGPFYTQPLYLGFVFPLLCMLAYSLTFLPFIADDALISLRYVQRFLDGHGLTWTDGIAVEGYSNLSWVMAIAVLGSLGMELIDATRALAAVLYASILWMNWCYWRHFLSEANRQFFYIAQYAFAFSATTGVWLVGGLEQPLVAACIAWAVFFLLRDQQKLQTLTKNLQTTGLPRLFDCCSGWLILSSLALGILCLTRPDSPLVCLALALALWFANGFTWQSFIRIAVLAIFPLLMVIAQLLFRLDYYGQWVATPALIKVQPSVSTMLIGLLYVISGLLCLSPFSYYCLRTLIAARASVHRFLIIVSSTTLSLWLTYLVFIGGDIFPAFRHFTLVSVFLSLLFPAVQFFFAKKQRDDDKPYRFKPKHIAAMAFIYIALQWFNPGTAFARGHLWVWDGEVIATAMKQGFGEQQPVLAVDAAGALPYWSAYPVIDMLGLNDYHIARTEPSADIKYVGHQFGDGDYIYNKRPDIINFCFPKGFFHPCWKSGQELWQMASFHDNYVPVRISGDKPYFVEGIQWFYKWSSITGIRRDDNNWQIPAYFFSRDARIDSREIAAVKITRAEENDIPEHLLRSFIAANQQWQVELSEGMPISYLLSQLPVNDVTQIEVKTIPALDAVMVNWEQQDNAQWLLTLQLKPGAASQNLESVVQVFSDTVTSVAVIDEPQDTVNTP